MSSARRLRSLARLLLRAAIALVVLVLVLLGAGIAALETGWAKNQLRDLVVRQANQYLTASLQIGRLGGSLYRGLDLGDIRLTRDGKTLVSIDSVSLSYSLRELFQAGVVIRRVELAGLKVSATRQADGRWDLATLVKREAREDERTGPGRPIEIASIAITDSAITLSEDVAFGAAHIPTRYDALNARLSFKYVPVRWTLDFQQVSFRGSAPDLTMNRLTGGLDNGPAGLVFRNLSVTTPTSAFTIAGRIEKGDRPTTIDLKVHAPQFAFQEWGGIVHGLRNIAVNAAFDTTLRGPLTKLNTDLKFDSNAGGIQGAFTLDTTVPGWLGAGAVTIDRLNLARWLSKADKPSDLSGRVAFDLAFGFGEHFPRGTYAFDGRHAMYMGYAGDNVHARGRLAEDEVRVAEATAVAYGANVRMESGTIGLREPFPFHFPGTVGGIDLRRLPAPVPVPHVESLLTFDYDVTGQFSDAFIAGRARFARSEFLGATIGDGTLGSIDTSVTPLTFSGDGEIDGVNLRRFGEGLDVAWMRDPRYAGTISGRFQAAGSAGDRAALRLSGTGRVRRADMMGGRFEAADVRFTIADGTLRTSFDGRLASIDPAIPLADDRFKASVTGTANVEVTVRDLLLRSPSGADFDVEGTAALRSSSVRDLQFDSVDVNASFRNQVATLRTFSLSGPAIQGQGSGSIGLEDRPLDFQYDITRADLARLKTITGANLSGQIGTKGRLTGSMQRPRFGGDATATQLAGPEIEALTASAAYDVTWPRGGFDEASGRAVLRGTFLKLFGQSVREADGTVTLAERRVAVDLRLKDAGGRAGSMAGGAEIRPRQRQADVLALTLSFGGATWRLAASLVPPTLRWSDDEIAIERLAFAGPAANELVAVSGTVRSDGRGAIQVVANRISLDTIQGAFEAPARYGGVLDLDATIRGTRQRPVVTGRIEVTEGRVRRVTYQRLAGRFTYTDGDFDVDLRLDQAPGVWVQARGKVPRGVFDRTLPERDIDLDVTSSAIDLGLVEGLTDVVRNVSGQMTVNLRAVGTSRDPHLRGAIEIAGAAFQVTATGVAYKNARASLGLSPARIDVETLHLEDSAGRPLDLHGSLATHELRVGDLEIDITARQFELLRNEFGRIEADALLHVRGRFESPRMVGDMTITGGELNVDEILERALFQPYSTEPIAIADVDPVRALNPWNRLALDLTLHIPRSLRLQGEDIQVAQNTPIGLGDIRLRVGGDLYLYKDPVQAPSITGSLYSLSGTYQFQGRRFEIDESGSSINFPGDLNPQMYVIVTRAISGVETRVLITGDIKQPELRLSSNPPLDPSDILSLIVFNTSVNDLTAIQQQELAVRAGTIAAGFFAKPLVSAIERSLGLEILEIEPSGDGGRGPRVTVGQELAPGLIARFSRQFGAENFDEATVEYYLSRLLRIRATFSDATAANLRSRFRRVERAGIDLLVFFSF